MKKTLKYQYQKNQFLRENLNPDADERTIKEHLSTALIEDKIKREKQLEKIKKQNKGLILLGTLIVIIFIAWAYLTLKTLYE